MLNYGETISPEEGKALAELGVILRDLLGDRLKKYVFFGSRARGDHDSESDIDVAIVVKDLSRQIRNDILDKIAELEMKRLVPISALVISEETFDFPKKRERRLALDLEREGIAL